jgi:hypothetical protein
MKIICSYCQKEMGQKAPFDDPNPTHGICPECEAYFTRQWNGLSMDEYLDEYKVPILVINNDDRVLAYNQAYSQRLFGEERKPRGLLSGEFLECRYARMPGGCGNTVCCRDCIIRKSIQETLKTGAPKLKVKAYLNQTEKGQPVQRELVISTEKKGEAVIVTIENISASKPG